MKYINTKKFKNKRKYIKKSLKSQIIFDKKVAIRLSNPRYYMAMGSDIINLDSKQKEKAKLSRPRQSRVTKIFEKYKRLFKQRQAGSFFILNGLYNKNKTCALSGMEPPTHSRLLSLVTSVPMLIISYAKIRRNKGALTLGAHLSYKKYQWLNPNQRRFLSRTCNSPDGLSYETFVTASKLLKQGKYPFFY